MSARVHIIGAGVAGLAAAVRLAPLGSALSIYEAAPRAGGRCRSYHDPHLGCVIDNGNHLLLSGNHAAMAYLAEIGARDQVAGPSSAAFPFIDVASGTRWSLQPGRSPIPWWIFDSARRVPGTGVMDYMSVLRVLRANSTETMTDCVGDQGTLYRCFWEPLVVAVLNTTPQAAAAHLMSPVLRETFLKGEVACRPLVARNSLAEALIDPAIAKLTAAGADIRMSTRVRALTFNDGRITALDIEDTPVAVGPQDTVILAVPPWIAETLVPNLKVPPPGEPIVNVHYRLAQGATGDDPRIVGVVGGTAQWVFARGDMASVTISAAADVVDLSADDIAAKCWPDVAAALQIEAGDIPPSRVVKERRATFAQTPEAVVLRPETQSKTANLLLAGDWTATGLPATIEGAIRSGFAAAALVAKYAALSARKAA